MKEENIIDFQEYEEIESGYLTCDFPIKSSKSKNLYKSIEILQGILANPETKNV